MSESYDPPTSATPSMPRQQASVPNPDPTQRTVEQVQRDIAAVRQIVEARIDGNKEVFETRLSGMDKAIELLQNATDKLPDKIKDSVHQLQQLHDERFHSVTTQLTTAMTGIETQFRERDTRATNSELSMKEAAAAQALSGTTAVNAALQAQKESAFATQQANSEAIRKSEAGFQERIKALENLIDTTKDSLNASITDVRRQLDRGEGGAQGAKGGREETRQNIGMIVGVIGGTVGALALVWTIVGAVSANKRDISSLSSDVTRQSSAAYAPPPGFSLVPSVAAPNGASR